MTDQSRRGAQAHAMPLAYLAVALAMIAALLPSALRPPPNQPPSSAAFSPDEPPEDRADIVSILNRGTSGTAGAGIGEATVPGAGGGGAPAPVRPRSRSCVGSPARQVESLYAGPCVPAFTGDNGGSTYRNVDRSEVRVAFYHSLDGCNGKISRTPPNNEGGGHRTARVLQDYMNQNFETYGRWVQFYCLPGGASDTDMRNNAVTADDEWKIFASSYIALGYCRDMVRRKLPVICDPPARDEMLASRPYLWSWQMERTAMEEIGAEYYCKKLAGKPARFAGAQSTYRTSTRRLGVITEVTTETGITERTFTEALRAECGARIEEQIIYSAGASPSEVASGIARLRAAGITTVMVNIKFVNAVPTFAAADGASYFPEWLLLSPYGLDVNIIGNLMSQSQWTQAFGISGWEWPRSTQEGWCYRAYKTLDPDNNPDGASCSTLFDMMIQLMSGISGAGPKLTPETFRDGLFRMGHRWYDDLPFAIGGGYGPADFSYIDNVGEIWWDPSAQKPEDGSPGAYRWTRCGKRMRRGEVPREDPLVFQEGSPGPGRAGCPPVPDIY